MSEKFPAIYCPSYDMLTSRDPFPAYDNGDKSKAKPPNERMDFMGGKWRYQLFSSFSPCGTVLLINILHDFLCSLWKLEYVDNFTYSK